MTHLHRDVASVSSHSAVASRTTSHISSSLGSSSQPLSVGEMGT